MPQIRLLCSNYAGRSKLVCSNNCITLLCTTSQFHHQSQTRSRRLLGDLCQQTTTTIPYSSCEDSITGSGLSVHGMRYFTVRDCYTETRHSLRIRLPVYLGHYAQNYLLFPHNAQCILVPIIPKIMPA